MPEPDTDANVLDGVLWTREEVAAFWPCQESTAARLMRRHNVERVGYDPDTALGTYRALDVTAARHAQPGQGTRTDIRDRSLSSPDQNHHYRLGRVISAAQIVLSSDRPTPSAAEWITAKIEEQGGTMTPFKLGRLHTELDRARRHDLDSRKQDAMDVVDALLPDLDIGFDHLTPDQSMSFFLGFSHQQGALRHRAPGKDNRRG